VRAISAAHQKVQMEYPTLKNEINEEVFFITTQELEDMYPNLSGKEREYEIVKEHKTVFIMQIGSVLKSGKKHDGRAPDYDDWNLNGDIILYNRVLDIPFEISSMGIRVDRDTLLSQLKAENKEDRVKFEFHQMLLSGALPLTIGGGIGQSRLCMFLLHKAHVGEVQVSIWPEKEIQKCKQKGINLL
jgi:aspartate--ammonia ligase